MRKNYVYVNQVNIKEMLDPKERKSMLNYMSTN